MRIAWQRKLAGAVAVATGIGLISGCTAALSSSESTSGALGSVSSASGRLVDAGSSVSSSSSEGRDGAALERDVSVYTVLFTDHGGDVNAYLRGVGALCERYAVTDWEREPAVARGIASGLARSRLSAGEIDAFAGQVSGGDARVRDSLRTAALALR